MTKASDYAKIFRAAAKGYVAPYNIPAQDSAGFISYPSGWHESKMQAYSMASAFNAIANVFETIAEAE